VIVREITVRSGIRTVRLVDYKTGKAVARSTLRERAADPWENHWSLSMGARTDEHSLEIAEKCRAANVPCQFDGTLRIKVNSAKHQQQLADAIFGKGKVSNHDRYY